MQATQAEFGQTCDDYVRWSEDPKRPRTTFYSSGDTATMVTCVPEYVLKAIGFTPGQEGVYVRADLCFTAATTDSQGKPALACVLSVKKIQHY
jgi:hypothetical protein